MLFEETAIKLCGSTPQASTLIKIMERFDMLVPYQLRRYGQRKKAYLVPCLLKRSTIQSTQSSGFPNMHFKLVPRVQQQFTSPERIGFLPHGVFHRLVSNCCRVPQWESVEGMVFYDYIAIHAKEFYFSLYMIYNGITLSAFKFQGKPENHSLQLAEIRRMVQSMIEEITAQVFPNLVCLPFLECNCLLPAEIHAGLK